MALRVIFQYTARKLAGKRKLYAVYIVPHVPVIFNDAVLHFHSPAGRVDAHGMEGMPG